MSAYDFSNAEKWGIFTVHGSICWYNREPINFRTMEVDHLIPGSLARRPAELKTALDALRLPPDFDLNSYENWLPICGPCNRTKSATVFEPTPLIQQQLKRAREGAGRAREEATKVVTDRQLANAIAAFERAADDRISLDEGQMSAVINSLLRADPELARRLMQARLSSGNYSNMLTRSLSYVEATAIVRLTPSASLYFMEGTVRLVQ